MVKKTVTMAQVLEAVQKAEELTVQVAQAAQAELETKQDKLAGVSMTYDPETKTLTVKEAG